MILFLGILIGYLLRRLGDGRHLPNYSVEIFTGFSIYYIINKYGIEDSIPYLICLIGLILASIRDIEIKEVPDRYFVIGTIFISIYRIIYGGFLKYGLSAITIFGILYAIYISTEEGLGGADVKIYLMIGMAIGLRRSLDSLFYGALFGIIYFAYLYLKGEDVRGYQLAFMPFILLGYLTALR